MQFQVVKWTTVPGGNPTSTKVGTPSKERNKVQRQADALNGNFGDQDYEPGQTIIAYGVEIVR